MFFGVIHGIWVTLPISPADTKTKMKLDAAENISAKKVVAFSEHVSLQTIKEIKTAMQATVNDVLVAIITAGDILCPFVLLSK